MYQDYSNGGLRALNVEVLFKSLHLAWISRSVVRDQNFLETWKSILNYFFEKYGGFNFLLHCNYDKTFLEKPNIPHFYRQILTNFLELKTLYGLQNESEVFFVEQQRHPNWWFEKGTISIHDILDHTGKLLTFHEFQKKYGVKCNFLNWFIPETIHTPLTDGKSFWTPLPPGFPVPLDPSPCPYFQGQRPPSHPDFSDLLWALNSTFSPLKIRRIASRT